MYVEYGQQSQIRASCLLATGVKLSRMTEPGETEWWKLGTFTKKSLDKLRKAWGESKRAPEFTPKAFPLQKTPKTQSSKPRKVTWLPLPPSSVTGVIFPASLFFHFVMQFFRGKLLNVPANQVYDDVRERVSKGLNTGGLRFLWDQFPLGKMAPMQYSAFTQIFQKEVGWRLFKPWKLPADASLRLRHTEAKFKKSPSLSFAQSELKQASVHLQNNC